MCGIAGFLAPPHQRAERVTVERMVTALRHRGPDATGFHVRGRIALGVARLRVIDLVHGDQPQASEAGDVQVVLNGEIYNCPALRELLAARGHRFASATDTEVIAHAWEERDERCIDDLNGMFAFAVWDDRRQRLVLARDRMGEKPLYYAWAGGWLVFASELRAVLLHPAVSRSLDVKSVARYLAFDYVPDPDTIIRGVAKLAPGHILTAGDGELRVERYWDMPFRPDRAVDVATWCDAVRAQLDAAVRARLISDVPLGCFLSGGIDSTAVTATAARLRPGLRTFSVGYAESRHDERPFARLVATQLGTIHEELVMNAEDAASVLPNLGRLLDEPLADMSFVPLYLLSRAARTHITVALTGDGGDELFAGYPSMAAAWWQRRFDLLPRPVRAALAAAATGLPGTPEPMRQFIDALNYRPAVRNQLLIGGLPPHRYAPLLADGMRAAVEDFDPYAELDGVVVDGDATPDATARLIRLYCKTYLAGQNLVNADRASMAVGLELRAPFLDHTLVELTGRIPSALKLQGLTRLKRLLKDALADRLPAEVRSRGKHGFTVPFGAWFRGPLAPFLRDTLAAPAVRDGGVFDARAVSRVVAEHLEGRRDHARALWMVLVFELWRRAQLAAA